MLLATAAVVATSCSADSPENGALPQASAAAATPGSAPSGLPKSSSTEQLASYRLIVRQIIPMGLVTLTCEFAVQDDTSTLVATPTRISPDSSVPQPLDDEICDSFPNTIEGALALIEARSGPNDEVCYDGEGVPVRFTFGANEAPTDGAVIFELSVKRETASIQAVVPCHGSG